MPVALAIRPGQYRNKAAVAEYSVEQFFFVGDCGLFAQNHDSYEYREGQVQMAHAIASAFQNKKHLLVEAGT